MKIIGMLSKRSWTNFGTSAIYLYDDKLVITFNSKEASKTVTLKEVNGSIIECSGAPNRNTVANAEYPVFATVFLNFIVPSYCYKFICISIF